MLGLRFRYISFNYCRDNDGYGITGHNYGISICFNRCWDNGRAQNVPGIGLNDAADADLVHGNRAFNTDGVAGPQNHGLEIGVERPRLRCIDGCRN